MVSLEEIGEGETIAVNTTALYLVNLRTIHLTLAINCRLIVLQNDVSLTNNTINQNLFA